MKKLLNTLLLAVTALAPLSTVAESLVVQYWPMNHGDIKYYTGPAGDVYIRFDNAGFFSPPRFNMALYVYDTDWDDYYEEFTGTIGYSSDELQLMEYGADVGYKYTWNPPIASLDEASLANGGSRTFQSVIKAPGTNIPVTVTITVTATGTVKVPAGTFNQCKTVSVMAKITGTSAVAASQAWVLAPKVGQIKVAVVNFSGKVVGWESLTDGTVGGVDVRDLANQIPPTLTITSPTPGQRISNAVATVTGTAKDNSQVTEVWYQLNGGAWNLAQTANGWTNWTANVNLLVGSNSISAYAVDPMDNTSLIKTVTFTYVLTAPLIVQTNGSGTVTPSLGGQLLEIGKSYTLTAKPAVRNLFAGWSGSLSSANTVLNFQMQSNLTFTANFVTNPFVRLKGKFSGLFSEDNDVRNHDRSGSFNLLLAEAGTYSASFQLGAKKLAAKGAFDWLGQSVLKLKPSLTETVTVVLQLDVTNLNSVIEGTVSNGDWVSPLIGDRAPVYVGTNASPQAGKYTLVIPGSDNAAESPGGDGYGTLTVSKLGVLKLAGKLADGTILSQSAPVSADGWWALYSTLYTSKGSLHGWMQFTNEDDSDISGELSWIKPALATSKYYPLGYTNKHEAVGSLYVTPTTNRVVNITNGKMEFHHGNLIQPITNNVLLTTNNKITNLSSNKLTMTFTLTSGLFKGSVTDTNTGKAIPFNGVLLQKLDSGYGHFYGTNQSGQALFGPDYFFKP